MAHYAQIENNIVTQVFVMSNDELNPVEWLGKIVGGEWVQTSYNTYGGVHKGQDGKPDNKPQLRYNYAGFGYIYDSVADAFYAPQPFPSWILNKTTYLWEAPTPMPTDNIYAWDEITTSWIELTQENN